MKKAPSEIVLWDIAKIIPYELNSKLHDEKQISGIATSIERFGFDQPIVVDADGVIIKGHGRRLACIKLGLVKVPVLVRSDLTKEQANAARIADNRVAVGDFDTDLLKAELAELDIDDLRGIFEDKELEFLAADLTALDDTKFVENLEEAVASQEEKMREEMDAADVTRIPVAKAFGFKDIAGANQIHINRFLAQVEGSTGKSGEEGFVDFIKTLKFKETA